MFILIVVLGIITAGVVGPIFWYVGRDNWKGIEKREHYREHSWEGL